MKTIFLGLLLSFLLIGLSSAHFETVVDGKNTFSNSLVGTASNGISIDASSGITFTGSAKRHLSMRPYIEAGRIGANVKPTIVDLGAITGYSLPLHTTDEEIFFNEYIAGRWDGASNITVAVIGYLDTAETANDDFNLTLEWVNKATSSGALTNSVNTVYKVTNLDSGRNAQYSIFKVELPIDWDLPITDVTASDFFSGKLYRSAVGAGNTEIDGEFVVTAIVISYQVDKVFKA